MLLYRLDPTHDADYTHAFLPVDEFDEWRMLGEWVLAREGEAYAAIWCTGGMKLTESGANRRREWVSHGTENVWVLRTSNAAECSDFDSFAKHIERMNIEFESDLQVSVTDPDTAARRSVGLRSSP